MLNRRKKVNHLNEGRTQQEKTRNSIFVWKFGKWRVIASLCILLIWTFALAPIVHRIYSYSKPISNISQNDMLLDKLNLSNVTVLCPEGYTFSRMEQRCSTVCGYYDNYPLPLTICKRVLLIAIAVINTGITILAIYRLIRYRKEYKFQHHPIFIGVFVNLILSIVIGVPDIIGTKIFFCEGKEIDYATLNANPTIQVHIHGVLIQVLSLSNRLWFVMALVYIFFSKLSMQDIFSYKRNKVIIILLEFILCFLFPVTCAVISYKAGYVFAPRLMMPITGDKLVGIIFGMAPQLIITGLTLTLIVLILYKIHCRTCIACVSEKQKELIPIEKRIMFFSVLYFVLNILIVLALLSTSSSLEPFSSGSEERESLVTLKSLYSADTIRPIAGTHHQTLSLLSTTDQELIPGYYLGARDAPLGARFLRNFSLGVWKFGQLPIDVIQNHGFRRIKIGGN